MDVSHYFIFIVVVLSFIICYQFWAAKYRISNATFANPNLATLQLVRDVNTLPASVQTTRFRSKRALKISIFLHVRVT